MINGHLQPSGCKLAWFRRAIVATIVAFATFVGLVATPDGSEALEIEFSGRPVKLDILALYDSRRERQPHLTRIHKFVEMPLNYLGYRVTYVDVNGRLPSVQSLGKYRGIVTWLLEPLQRPETVLGWLDEAVGRGLKYVVLGEPAPPGGEVALPQINRLLARIGLELRGDFVDLTWRVKVIDRDPDVIGFERPIDKVLPGFPVVAVKNTDVDPHLVLENPSSSGPIRSVIVATAPGGGFAASSYIVYYEPNTDRVRWFINPFAFFARAFGSERRPIPDTTTLAGRRIYFSHIDGDGWNNVSEIEGHRELQRTAAEVIEREAIVPFPDLPVSVGLIAGDIEPTLGGQAASAAVARRMFALPQVEVASHTYTHPFNWQFFEKYDRQEELRLVEQTVSPSSSARERFSRQVLAIAGRPAPVDRSNKYVAGSDDLPRTFLKNPFDLEQETVGALRSSEALAPPGKRAMLYLWSGDTTPFPGAIRALRRVGALNLNGGDSRLDAEFPSVAYVPPLSRPAGGERQIYAANSNENTYTNDWTGPYYGFFMLEKTLENTDSPRRLKPFNLYYHMYSGEKTAALAAVRHILDKARHDRVIPIAASHYASIADDFFGVDIVQVDLFSWSVSRRGALSTLRFDDAEQLSVDMPRSEGVLGESRHGSSLYVALDSSRDRALVSLRSRAGEEAARRDTANAGLASLVESRWRIFDLARETCGFRFTAQGYGTGDMTWRTSPRRAFRVAATRGEALLSEETLWANEQGVFQLSIGPAAIEPIQIRFTCHE